MNTDKDTESLRIQSSITIFILKNYYFVFVVNETRGNEI